MIRLDNYKLNRAKKVLAYVNKHLPSRIRKQGWIEAYSNGREQGLHIKFYGGVATTVSFSFSEYRNSDDIVVYTGEQTSVMRFAMQGNVPNEEIYKNKMFFNTKGNKSGEEQAGEYIVKTVMGVFN
jgi:hypothetical protein